MSETQAIETVDEAGPPVALLQGSFAIYRTPDQGLLLVWRKKGTAEDHHVPVPPFVLKMAAGQSGLTLDELIARITDGESA